MEKENYKNLLVGITGSVAAVRFEQIIQQFYSLHKFNIKAIITDKAKIFLEKLISDYKEIEKKYECEIYFDNDEFELYKKDENRVLHIELRKWADLVLLAPLSANTLAKITNGICDNLLTSVIRAWDFKKKGFFCLAMNTLMYDHFITQKQVNILVNEFKFIQIPSVCKKLKCVKCGDIGMGGIADTKDIVKIVCENLNLKIE